MFVAVFPPTPSQALIGALLAAGYQPVPVESLADVGKRAPESGWAAGRRRGRRGPRARLGVAAKLRTERRAPGAARHRSHPDRRARRRADDFDDFILSPIDRDGAAGSAAARLAGVAAEHRSPRTRSCATATSSSTRPPIRRRSPASPRDLTYMEYELLRFFVENPGRVWSREQILSQGVGLRLLRRLAHRRRPRAPAARQARRRTQLAGSPPCAASATASAEAVIAAPAPQSRCTWGRERARPPRPTAGCRIRFQLVADRQAS